jgi:hypothetical protein
MKVSRPVGLLTKRKILVNEVILRKQTGTPMFCIALFAQNKDL